MKQINLLPSATAAIERFRLHGFWRNYFALSVILLSIAAGIAWSMEMRVREYAEELPRAQQRLDGMEPQYQHFVELVKERDALRDTVAELEREFHEELSPSLVEDSSISSEIRLITEMLPDRVWLRDIDCKLQDRKLILGVSAETETAMRRFLMEGLERHYGENAVSVNSVQREKTGTFEIRYEVEIHLGADSGDDSKDSGEPS